MKRNLVLILIIFILSSCASGAQTSKLVERNVLLGRIFAETTYNYTEYPLDQTDIVLIAAHNSILWARRTNVYFWPLTNDWKTDFQTVNDPVGGKLEISQNDRIVQTQDLTSYVVQIDAQGSFHLFLGADADTAYKRFQNELNNYYDQLSQYQSKESQYQAAVATALAQEQKTGIAVNPNTLPPEPAQPNSFKEQSSAPAEGYPVQLPKGDYEIKLIDDKGVAVAGTTRKLHVVEPIKTEIAYQVVPEDQWTEPEWSYDVGDSINLHAGEAVYLEPEIMHEYYLKDWQRIQSPQEPSLSGDAVTWIQTVDQLTNINKMVTSDRQVIDLTQYRVLQNPGAALGYTIIEKPVDDQKSPDLVAYRLNFSAPGLSTQFALSSTQGVSTSSTRNLISVNNPNFKFVPWILSILPIGFFLILNKINRSSRNRVVKAKKSRKLN